jgi:hypothetical protein
LAVFTAATVAGWDWPNIAKIMPVYVAALPGLVLVLVQLYRDATGWETRRSGSDGGSDMDETYELKLEKKTEVRRTLMFFAWFTPARWASGCGHRITLLLPALRWSGKARLPADHGGLRHALVWGLQALETRWPPGILFG